MAHLADSVTVTGALSGATADLAAGNDTLVLNGIGNSLSARGIESLVGGAGADTIVLLAPSTDARIDLKSGNDILLLADGTNFITVTRHRDRLRRQRATTRSTAPRRCAASTASAPGPTG